MRRDYKRRLLYYIWVLRGKHLGIRVSVGLQLAHNLPTKNSYGLLHMGPIYITAVFYVYRANTYGLICSSPDLSFMAMPYQSRVGPI